MRSVGNGATLASSVKYGGTRLIFSILNDQVFMTSEETRDVSNEARA